MLESEAITGSRIELPEIIFGTSSLGNLYEVVDEDTKKAIIKECIDNSSGIVLFDTAGKYGAGLALETLGKYLKELEVDPRKVLISNKLGWYRTELTHDQPTFEPGVWAGLKHDAIQKISYDGILACYEQGNILLGDYAAQMVSIHDPDEYLAAANGLEDEEVRYSDILNAYQALLDLKKAGRVQSVGIGCKDWKVIQRICKDVKLDWVMIANSLTVHSHPTDLIDFIGDLQSQGISVINSAVFNGGFLTGSDYYNYQKVNYHTTNGDKLYLWRYKFYTICKRFEVDPAQACVEFGLQIKGVNAIALNTTKPEKVKLNIALIGKKAPEGFWQAMIAAKLIHISIDTFKSATHANTDL